MIVTWNVRSLYRVRAMQELKSDLTKYKIHIAALQEIRWRGKEIMDLKDSTLFNSGNRNNTLGTGFLVSKRIKYLVIDFKAVNERICTIRIRGRCFNTTFINCHAPTEEKEATVKDAFYESLQRTYETAHRHEIK